MTRKIIIYIFTFLTAIFAVNNSVSAQNSQLIINELMQSNVEEIMDDLNEFPDSWVEIYNRGPAAVILSEYKIGITSNPSEAWALPAITLPAGGYQLTQKISEFYLKYVMEFLDYFLWFLKFKSV